MIDTNVVENFVEDDITRVIWQYIPPILILIGTVGNLLSLGVLAKTNLHSSSTRLYLVQLTFTDIVVLNTGLLRLWMMYTFDFHIRLTSRFVCRFHAFVVYMALDYSAWILVLLTVDRCVSVCLPMWASKFCSLRTARFLSASTILLLVAINLHFFWTYDLVKRTIYGNGMDCDAVNPHFRVFVDNIWPLIDRSISYIIPFVIMIVGNIFIARHILKSFHKITSQELDVASSSGQYKHEFVPEPLLTVWDQHGNVQQPPPENPQPMDVKPEHIFTESKASKSEPIAVEGESGMNKTKRYMSDKSSSSQPARIKGISSLTVMLFSLNCLFFMLMSPVTIFLIGFVFWSEDLDAHQESRLALGWAIVNTLMYLNNTIRFFLYYPTLPAFRRRFLSICKRSGNPSITWKHSETTC